jgi:HEAT repeat protein
VIRPSTALCSLRAAELGCDQRSIMNGVAVSWGEIQKLQKRGDTASLVATLTGDEVRELPKHRRHIALALGQLRDPRSVEVLMQVARQDSDMQVRRIAMQALAHIGDRAAVPLFVETLHCDDGALRLHASIGLGNSGANEAVRPLIELLDDSKTSVRSAAARRLADLGDEAAVGPIREAKRRAWWRPFHRMSMKLALDILEERNRR